ncbi:replication/maintenance protein RepL [Campylobacter helveticus]|uniref:replication/maintenance protein RepL n=1 Tax=Campylobacter helveticus TaxID=28898 RepID=UPI00214B0F53|nr:replication/maintenance protein RepL [Campylobacter helveticus]MCR2060363.1 replication/maintenance protein RepL [Campylobacter helveticus]
MSLKGQVKPPKVTQKLAKIRSTWSDKELWCLNKKTGETEKIDIDIFVGLTIRDTGFFKMFYQNFIEVLESYFSGSKFKVSVLKLLLLNADKENCIFATSVEMAKALDTTQQNVSKELKALQNCGFIKKIKNGVYQINPDYLFKGSTGARQAAKEKFNKSLKV